MRRNEWCSPFHSGQGIPLMDENGNIVGHSPKIGQESIIKVFFNFFRIFFWFFSIFWFFGFLISRSKAKQSDANARATCYPGARVSHVTLCFALLCCCFALLCVAFHCLYFALPLLGFALPGAPVSHVTPGRPCHMLPWGARVTCYPGANEARQSQATRIKWVN